MAAVRVTLFWLVSFMISAEAQKIIRPEVGQNVILPCKVPKNKILIRAVKWSRPDQDPEYVLFYRDGRLYPYNQHPSYQNRVDLKDKDMKDGDFSMILKNVMKTDTGRYECRVFQRRKVGLISIINLEVHGNKEGISGDGGDNDGRNKDIVIIVPVVIVILLLAVSASLGFLIYRRHMRQNSKLLGPPDEAAAEQMLQNKDMKVFLDQHQQQPQLV